MTIDNELLKGASATTSHKFPDSEVFNFGRPLSEAMYIRFICHEVTGVSLSATGGDITDGGLTTKRASDIPVLDFLAPPEVVTTGISHSWEKTSNIGSRLGEKFQSMKESWSQVTAVGNTLWDAGKKGVDMMKNSEGKDIKPDTEKSAAIMDKMKSGFLGGTEIKSHFKYDAPLVYKDSSNIEYSFVFQLAHFKNNFREVIEPVNLLQWLASPGANGKNDKGEQVFLKIDLPYVFTVQSVTASGTPTGLINMHPAAITALQPTWYSPYIKGHPCRCELTLTVKDLRPQYKKMWADQQNKLSVSMSDNKIAGDPTDWRVQQKAQEERLKKSGTNTNTNELVNS